MVEDVAGGVGVREPLQFLSLAAPVAPGAVFTGWPTVSNSGAERRGLQRSGRSPSISPARWRNSKHTILHRCRALLCKTMRSAELLCP